MRETTKELAAFLAGLEYQNIPSCFFDNNRLLQLDAELFPGICSGAIYHDVQMVRHVVAVKPGNRSDDPIPDLKRISLDDDPAG